MKKIMFNDRYGLTKAVMEGRKTMTRRIVPDGTPLGNWADTEKMSRFKVGEVVAVAQPYKDCVNEILVNWGHKTDIGVMVLRWFRQVLPKKTAGWNNKMFVRADLMPHQIRITSIRVEQLQEISDQDCMREGIMEGEFMNTWDTFYYDKWGEVPNHITFKSPREAFAALINRISGKGTWESNPWVYVYEFELVK